jgi:hypothetical protein
VDLAYHLRAGAEILATRAIPATDTWTFTVSGEPWTNQQSGAQVLFAAVFQLGGWTGLVLLRAVLVGVAFGAMFLGAREQGLPVRWAALLTLVAFLLSAVALALRPQLLGVVLFAITLLLLLRRHRSLRVVWLVPLLALAWANLHGSFVLVAVAVGWAWLEDAIARHPATLRTAAVGVVALLATFVNPFGPGVWAYALGIASNTAIGSRVSEWQPPTITDPQGILFYGSVALVAAVLVARRRRVRLTSLALLLPLLALGIQAVRGLAWWPIGAAVVVAGVLAPSSTGVAPPGEPARATPPVLRRLNALTAVALVLVGVALLPVWRPADPVTGPAGVVTYAPPGITATLRDLADPDDRLFHPQVWGSWLEFAVPQARTFVDSRIELFPARVWEDYDTVMGARPGWDAVLDRWGVTIVVVAADGNPALLPALTHAGWHEAYLDDDGWVFIRADR